MQMHGVTIRANLLAGRGEEALALIRQNKPLQAAEQAIQQTPDPSYQELVEGMKEAASVESFLDTLEQDIDSLLNAL